MLRSADFRRCRRRLHPDNLPLGRIIIHEYQAFRQNIQLYSDILQVLALRLPVSLDHDKIIRLQSSRRMLQSCHGVFFLVLGIDVEHHADIFLGFYITLKLCIYLPHGSLLSDLQIVRSVIPYDAPPQRIVQIQNKGLFVFPENRFYNIAQIVCKFRNGLHTKTIFIHMPVKRIRPLVQSIGCRNIIYIINIKILMGFPILVKTFVQTCQETSSPADGRPVLISQQAVERIFKIILYHRAMVIGFQFVPHRAKMPELLLQQSLCLFPSVSRLGTGRHVPAAGMDINHIRRKILQPFVPEHGILKVLTVFRLIKLRFNPLMQKKKFQNTDNIVSSTSSQNRYFLPDPHSLFRQKNPS